MCTGTGQQHGTWATMSLMSDPDTELSRGAGQVSSGPKLALLIERLGPSVVRVLAVPRGLDRVAGGPVVHDPDEPLRVEPGAIVLAVGSRPADAQTCDVIAAAAESSAAAVVVKLRGAHAGRIVAAAEAAGIPLLAAADDIAWRHLDALLTSASEAGAPPDAVGSGESFGDLFALANAVAAMVGGAVAIEDPQKRVLAYSNLADQPIDAAREQGILGRQVPMLPGVAEGYRRLWRTPKTVWVHLPELGLRPRLAVAVRAGDEVLGSIWVVEGDQPLGAEAEQALADAGRIAALDLLRARSAADLDRRTQADVLRSLLDGDSAVDHLASRLDIDPLAPVTIIAFIAVHDPSSALLRHQVVDLATVSCEAFRRLSVCLAVGGVTYAMLPLSDPASSNGLVRLAEEIVSRARRSLHVTLQAGIGSVVTGLQSLPQARHEADQVLRVLNRETADPRVATIDDVRSKAVLLELADGQAGSSALRLEGLSKMLAHDSRKQTDYATTLRAFFEAFGDVPAAAKRIGVHQNTFRYRLRRIVDLFHVHLDDPDELLVLWLQLRLLSQQVFTDFDTTSRHAP